MIASGSFAHLNFQSGQGATTCYSSLMDASQLLTSHHDAHSQYLIQCSTSSFQVHTTSNTSTRQKSASIFTDQKCCTSHLRARQILFKTPTTQLQKKSSHILPIIFLSPDFLKSNPVNKEFLHTYNSSHKIGRYYSDQWQRLFLWSSHVQFLFVPPLSNHHMHWLSFYSFSPKIHSRPPISPEEILIKSNNIVAKLVFLPHIAFNPKLQEEKFQTCNAHIVTTPFLRLLFLSYSEQGFEDWWHEYDHINMCLHLP